MKNKIFMNLNSHTLSPAGDSSTKTDLVCWADADKSVQQFPNPVWHQNPVDLVKSAPQLPIDLVKYAPQLPIDLVKYATHPGDSPYITSIEENSTGSEAVDATSPLLASNQKMPTSYQLAAVLATTCQFHLDGGNLYIYDTVIKNYLLLQSDLHVLIRQNCPPDRHYLCTPAAEKDCTAWLLSHFFKGQDQGPLPELPRYVPFSDCVYDLDSGKYLTDSRQKMFLTFSNKVKLLSDSSTDCPVFDSYMTTITQDSELLSQNLLAMMAYVISNCRSMKSFFLLVGPRDCGKSVCLKILEEICGFDACSHIPLNQLMGRFNPSELANKRLNDVGETDSLNPKTLTALKQITGGDTISADVKHRSHIVFRNKAVLIFSTNRIEGFAENIHPDDPVWRRMIPLIFSYSVPLEQQDPQLLEKIQAEFPAIVKNRIIPALRNLYQNGWIFPNPDYVEQCRQLLLTPDSSISGFIQECCQLDNNACVRTEDLYQHYLNYCKDTGRKEIKRNSFFDSLILRQPTLSKVRKRLKPNGNPVHMIKGISIPVGE